MSQASGIASLLESRASSQPLLQAGHHMTVHAGGGMLEAGTSAVHGSSLTGMQFNAATGAPLNLSRMTDADGLQSVLAISSASPEHTLPSIDSRGAFTVTSLSSQGRLSFNPTSASLGVASSLPQSPHCSLPSTGGGGIPSLPAIAGGMPGASTVHASSMTSHLGAGGGMGGADVADLTHVLSGLQQTGELSAVLQQQPHLAEGLSSITAGDVSADPESLRFRYDPMEDSPPSHDLQTPTSKKAPQVYKEQYRFLPIANVARIMRNVIPKNGKVSKDAKECMQECVSEFVSFITSESCDKCSQEKRKTITGDDILFAMAALGFDNYIEPLRLYLQKYREFLRSEKVSSAGGSAASSTGDGETKTRSQGAQPMEGLQHLSSGLDGAVAHLPDYSSYSSLVAPEVSRHPAGAEQ